MAAAPARFVLPVALGLLVVSTAASAAPTPASGRTAATPPVSRLGSFAPGALAGVVLDERGVPVPGVIVSALGATTTLAVTDKDGRFEFGTLAPGPYIVRAHLAGFVAPRAKTIQVGANARAASDITLRHVGAPTTLAASLGVAEAPAAAAPPVETVERDDAHSETAWRIRHTRRTVLKDTTLPAEYLEPDDAPSTQPFGTTVDLLARAVETPARFFTETPFSGQVNLLTTGSFDTPQDFLTGNSLARNIAFVRVGAPAGESADWNVNGAVTQSDISSWIVAGSYVTHAPARHRYDLGVSYSAQRYDTGNFLALREIADSSRNVGSVYGYDSFAVMPSLTVTYGATYARYDYLSDRNLLSPRAEMMITPARGTRVSAAVARRALAPGAEEFLPPAEGGFWLPPQRTFSSFDPRSPYRAEQTTHTEAALERDFGVSTVTVRGFRQHVDDQLTARFGTSPDHADVRLGHYVVGNVGDVDATGCSLAVRTVFARRVQSYFEYQLASAELTAQPGRQYLLLFGPSGSATGAQRVQSFETRVETEVPETATRVLVFYRLSNGFAPDPRNAERSGLDGRFDVQVRQSLPFMNFSNARWEMLVAVRNFFREAATEQSIYDELLVVRPPKRIVGGVALRF